MKSSAPHEALASSRFVSLQAQPVTGLSRQQARVIANLLQHVQMHERRPFRGQQLFDAVLLQEIAVNVLLHVGQVSLHKNKADYTNGRRAKYVGASKCRF